VHNNWSLLPSYFMKNVPTTIQPKFQLPFTFTLWYTVRLTSYDNAYSVNIVYKVALFAGTLGDYFAIFVAVTFTTTRDLQTNISYTYWFPSYFICGETDQRFVLFCNAFILKSQQHLRSLPCHYKIFKTHHSATHDSLKILCHEPWMPNA